MLSHTSNSNGQPRLKKQLGKKNVCRPATRTESKTDVNSISLTGIKPSGAPHIGNYLGMIQPALQLAKSYQAYYFIADYHALTAVEDRNSLQRHIYEVAAAWLSLGLDPDKVVFYRQSDVPEVFELAWILACHAAKGLLNRAHAYKSAVDRNVAIQKPADADVNAGLFFYPVLMAADILLFDADVVPVGADQKQHVEIARDIAAAFNWRHGRTFKPPQALIHAEAPALPGIDGQKMSKSYKNTIPIFAESPVIRKQVMRIVTDSSAPEDSKDPEACSVFAIYRHFASPEAVDARRKAYIKGGLPYSRIKQELFELLEDRFDERRRQYFELLSDTPKIDRILTNGAQAARSNAKEMLGRVRRKIGIN